MSAKTPVCYELVRDDGDMFVGLGMSYSYYKVREDGIHSMSHDLTRDYGPIDLTNR